MTKAILLVLVLSAATACASPASSPPAASCGAGGEVVTIPRGLISGIDGKVPVNIGRGPDACQPK